MAPAALIAHIGSSHTKTKGCRRTLKAKTGPMHWQVPHMSTLHYSWWRRKSHAEQWSFPGVPNWPWFQTGWSSSCESRFLICCLLKQTVAYLPSRHILWQYIMGALLSNPQGLSKYKQINEVLTPIPHHAHDITVIFFNLLSKNQALSLLFNHKVKSPEAASGYQQVAEKARHSQMKQPQASQHSTFQRQHRHANSTDNLCQGTPNAGELLSCWDTLCGGSIYCKGCIFKVS